jgi:hypothetical protein
MIYIPCEVEKSLNIKLGRLLICNFPMIASKPAGGGVETQIPSREGAFESANPFN